MLTHLFRPFYLVLSFVLLILPAWGDTLYSNGPIDGTNDGDLISQGIASSDSFVLGSGSVLSGASNVGIWVDSGDALTSFFWGISTAPDDGGRLEGNGSGFSSIAELTPTASYGFGGEFNVYNVSFTIDNLALATGTYYLTLQSAATERAGSLGVADWDVNRGPSSAAEYSDGTLGQNNISSNSFEIDGSITPVPEPGEIFLLGIGFVAFVALKLRNKSV